MDTLIQPDLPFLKEDRIVKKVTFINNKPNIVDVIGGSMDSFSEITAKKEVK